MTYMSDVRRGAKDEYVCHWDQTQLEFFTSLPPLQFLPPVINFLTLVSTCVPFLPFPRASCAYRQLL